VQGINVSQPEDVKVINSTIRRVINRIEDQHIIVFSTLLSISVGTSLGLFINEVASTLSPLSPLRVSLTSALSTALQYFIVLPLILFTTGILIVTFVYLLFRGVYSSTFTFIYRVPTGTDWKKELKETLAREHKEWHIYAQKCEDIHEHGIEYVMCEHVLKDPVKLKIKSMAFKLETGSIVWTSTLTACPLRVLFLEVRGGLLLEALAKLVAKLRRKVSMEVDLWYDAVENLTFFYNYVRERLEEKGVILEGIIS